MEPAAVVLTELREMCASNLIELSNRLEAIEEKKEFLPRPRNGFVPLEEPLDLLKDNFRRFAMENGGWKNALPKVIANAKDELRKETLKPEDIVNLAYRKEFRAQILDHFKSSEDLLSNLISFHSSLSQEAQSRAGLKHQREVLERGIAGNCGKAAVEERSIRASMGVIREAENYLKIREQIVRKEVLLDHSQSESQKEKLRKELEALNESLNEKTQSLSIVDFLRMIGESVADEKVHSEVANFFEDKNFLEYSSSGRSVPRRSMINLRNVFTKSIRVLMTRGMATTRNSVYIRNHNRDLEQLDK